MLSVFGSMPNLRGLRKYLKVDTLLIMKKNKTWSCVLLLLLGGCEAFEPSTKRLCGSPCPHVEPRPVDDDTLLSTYRGSGLGRALIVENQLVAAKTFQNLLQTGNENQIVSWENKPQQLMDDAFQEAKGTFMVFNPTVQGWASCLEYEQTLTLDGHTSSARGTACREDQGIWRITREIPYRIR